jgi:RNA polymerase sigma-70 factor, ECF subfamily
MAMRGKLISFPQREANLETLSDHSLVAASANGQQEALGVLFDRHAEAVTKFLGRMRTTDRSDLEDLLQLTFLQAQRSAHSFKAEASTRTWLFAIASHVAGNHVRGKQRGRRSLNSLAALPAQHTDSPADIVERRQLMDKLSLAMDDLTHELREAFVMCDVEEIPGVEVARVLGIRPGTLWRRLHDARKKLRVSLKT